MARCYTQINLYPPVSNFDFGTALDTTAPFIIRYDDVGKIKLHARITAQLMSGSSNEFVVRPFAFYPEVLLNLAATTAHGTIFTVLM